MRGSTHCSKRRRRRREEEKGKKKKATSQFQVSTKKKKKKRSGKGKLKGFSTGKSPRKAVPLSSSLVLCPTLDLVRIWANHLDPNCKHVSADSRVTINQKNQTGGNRHTQELPLKQERSTGRSRGFGYVTFASAEDAKRALESEHVLGNRTLEVKIATPKELYMEKFANHGVKRYKTMAV
ncbi:hypothetical protein Taro_003270 [Colocasia esculenta]|uniref:RRM domain-containing protein n=1 Tax=Colocasia esculenta TaxID=4460 RepID=A0A843TR79_COLES|nr:hypothetical protein [Colocasia esculenta]